MKLRSRGLGRRELVMDFREYEIKREGHEVVIEGTITEPVTWDFTIRIEPRDIPGMLRVGMNHHTLGLGARWILHRKANPPEVVGDGEADKTEKAGRRERAEKAVRREKAGKPETGDGSDPATNGNGNGNGALPSRASGGFGAGLKAG
jgi:hypothetical protein